ncbi:MltR family transcriptional regulator [Nostoc sp.]|uniref:MltR family transcriptional regulator n=1 Tax=Nostoc sp. TaxID=1180 RepID=UPI002FF9CEC8
MNEKIQDYVVAQTQKVVQFRQALTSESDRGCALFAAAYLDVCLSDLLYVSLVENKNIDKDLFEGTAPLSNFSSRIKLAYYLGLISRNSRRDLDIVRGIRNDFAHRPEIISFETQSIRDRCNNLSFSYHEKDAEPRSHFTAAVMTVLGHIHIATLTTTPHTEKTDDTLSEEDKKR